MRRHTLSLFACSSLVALAACTHGPTAIPSSPSAAPPAETGSPPGTGGSSTSGTPASSPSQGGATPSGRSTPARPPSYVPSPPSPAAREALRLFQEGCPAEGFNDALCGKAVSQLEAVVQEDPSQLDAQLALADALWNQAFRQPRGSAEHARLQQRSIDRYQRLVDQDVPDARPYYALSVLTRNPDTRLRLLRRAVELEPKHSDAHADLAWQLLERGQTDEAMREYRLHLSLSPSRDRADAFEDIRFARRLGELGHVREAAQIYDAVWDSLRDESRAERCQVFKTVELDPYERIGARFAQQVRAIRGACSDMPGLERAQELERQGQDDAAARELERQIQQNPVPVEPYLELERLHRKHGRVDEAAAVMTRYFQREKDPQEGCRHFRTLASETTRAMEPALVNEWDRTCRGR